MNSVILDNLDKIQYSAPNAVITKATEYYSRCVTNCNSPALPLVCIHLACNQLKASAPVTLLLANCAATKEKYKTSYNEISDQLLLERPNIVILANL